MEEILAIAEMDASTKNVAPVTELSVEDLMVESAMNSLGVSSDKSEKAKQELNEYIAVMLEKEKEDAFEAVRYAIYKVVPQVMTYREAVLEETADDFKMVNELNNDMLDMQGKFAASNDTTGIGDAHAVGVETALEYFEKAGMNAEKVNQMMQDGVLPNGIGTQILENLNDITSSTYEMADSGYGPNYFDPRNHKYGQAAGLFNGLVGIEKNAYITETEGSQSYFVYETPSAKQDTWTNDRSRAYGIDSSQAPYASQLNDNNVVIQSSLNGYSKKVEADFKFKIEEYGQYLSLSSQLYDSGVKSVQVHVKEQRG